MTGAPVPQGGSWSIPNVASATPVTGGSWSIPNMGMQSSWEQQALASAMARRQRMGMQLGGSWSIPNSSALSHNFGSMSVPHPNAPRSLAGSVEVPNPNAGDLQPATPKRPWWLKNPSAEDMQFGTMTREKLEHRPVPVRIPWTTLESAAHRHVGDGQPRFRNCPGRCCPRRWLPVSIVAASIASRRYYNSTGCIAVTGQ